MRITFRVGKKGIGIMKDVTQDIRNLIENVINQQLVVRGIDGITYVIKDVNFVCLQATEDSCPLNMDMRNVYSITNMEFGDDKM